MAERREIEMLCLEQCWKYILRKSLATLLALALEAPYLKLSAGFLHYLNHPGVCHGLCGGVGLLDGQRTKHGGDTQSYSSKNNFSRP